MRPTAGVSSTNTDSRPTIKKRFIEKKFGSQGFLSIHASSHCQIASGVCYLKAFPNPITNDDFDPAPEAGPGFTDGGFDAPRKPHKSPWWHAWSWDYYDMSKTQPPGNPQDPAFGFRQCETAHWVRDMFAIAAEAGLPKELMFAHQIPGEVVGAPRDRSSASPVWSGYLPFNGTVGITRFGPIDTKLLTQYTTLNPESRGWGIFEWHP